MDNSEFYKQLYDDELYFIDKPNTVEEPVETYEHVKLKDTTTESPQKEIEVEPISFKGGNKKGIAILVNYPTDDFINANDESFLLKVLTAVQLTIEDVSIINYALNSHIQAEALSNLNINTCLSFGVNLNNNSKEQYQPHTIYGITILNCSSLAEIQKMVEEKKLLWSNLQKLFLN